MKLSTKTCLALVLLFAISCTKESNLKSSTDAVTNASTALFRIGQHYGGGVIFYIDSTKKHGFIADTSDLPAAAWNNDSSYVATGAQALELGTGKSNTRLIISVEGKPGNYAALECAQSTRNGYTDWFLPSFYELDSLHKYQNKVGGFSTGWYWSSSEDSAPNGELYLAYAVKFTTGTHYNTLFKSDIYNVRAIRKF